MEQTLDIKYHVARLSIITLAFDHAFSLGKFISLPIFFSACFLFLSAITLSKKYYNLNVIVSLIVFLLLLTLTNTVSAINAKDTTLFLQGYRVFFYFAYFVFFTSVLFESYSIDKVIEWLYISFVITTVFGLIYFVFQNFIGIDLDSYMYRPSVVENSGSIGRILRNRSFFEEAGNFSFYLNLVFPIIIFGLQNNTGKFKFFFIFVLYSSSMITTFSATGFVVFFIICFSISMRKLVVSGINVSNYFRLMTIFIFFSIFFLYLQGNDFVVFSIDKITEKIFLDQNSSSAVARTDGVSVALEYINDLYTSGDYLSLFFGSGAGASQVLFDISIVSGQLHLLIDQGIFFMVFFYFLFLIFTYFNYIKSHNIIYYSGLSFFVYQFLITNYASMFVVVCLSLLLEITREKTNSHNSML